MTPRPAALLFDLDGTLADSFAGIEKALNQALAEHGLPGHDLAWVRRQVGRGAVALVRDAVGDAQHAFEAVYRRYRQRYAEIYLAETPVLPAARAVLELVSLRIGGRVAVVSNKHTELCRGWLEAKRLDHLVAVVLGVEEGRPRKPDPAAVLPALERLGVAPGDALLVGDMAIDVATGIAAGIPVVAVLGGASTERELRQAGPLAVLDSIAGLPAWLAANGAGWR